jgi:hypothetical protein
MQPFMTDRAERNQVQIVIRALSAAKLLVVDLQVILEPQQTFRDVRGRCQASQDAWVHPTVRN